VTVPSGQAIIARRAVSVPVGSAVGFVSSVVALEFSVESPAGDSQHFRCSGFISIRECDGAADEFAFNLIERRAEENGKVALVVRGRSNSSGNSLTEIWFEGARRTAVSITLCNCRDVAGPSIVLQGLAALVVHAFHPSVVITIRVRDEIVYQKGQIVDAFPER
jgi:hypothetical protein